ncbi:MAG: SH3 domain-containing protein [Microcoleaceae cyanobacterium]
MKGRTVLATSVLSGLVWAGSALAQSPEKCPQPALNDIGQVAYVALRYETAENVVIICEVRSGRLYLHSAKRESHSDPHVTLPASPTRRKYEYSAQSGETRYIVNSNSGFTKIEDGKIIMREGLYSWDIQPMPDSWRGASASSGSFKGRDFALGTAAQVTPQQVNVRSRPNARSGVVTKLKRGTTVEVTDREDNSTDGYIWYKISVPQNGRQGWIRGDLLRPS